MKLATKYILALTLVAVAHTASGLDVLVGRNLMSLQSAQTEVRPERAATKSLQIKLAPISDVLLPRAVAVSFSAQEKAEVSFCVTAAHGRQLFNLAVSEDRSNVSKYEMSGVFVGSILSKQPQQLSRSCETNNVQLSVQRQAQTNAVNTDMVTLVIEPE